MVATWFSFLLLLFMRKEIMQITQQKWQNGNVTHINITINIISSTINKNEHPIVAYKFHFWIILPFSYIFYHCNLLAVLLLWKRIYLWVLFLLTFKFVYMTIITKCSRLMELNLFIFSVARDEAAKQLCSWKKKHQKLVSELSFWYEWIIGE